MRFGHHFYNQDMVERLWRNIFGGAASCRFHRPDRWLTGIGLHPISRQNIRSMRMFTDALNLFVMEPHNELLSSREENEAYKMVRRILRAMRTHRLAHPVRWSLCFQQPLYGKDFQPAPSWPKCNWPGWNISARISKDSTSRGPGRLKYWLPSVRYTRWCWTARSVPQRGWLVSKEISS